MLLLAFNVAKTQTPPNVPVVTEPAVDGQIVSPADVHMETQPMTSADPTAVHDCSDWQIVVQSTSELIWNITCIAGVEKVHVHLGDGTFVGSYAGRTQLFYDTDYTLRVRQKDNHGLYSPWAERPFRTGSQSQIFPLIVSDATSTPIPQLLDGTGIAIIIPPGATPPSIRIENSAGQLILSFQGFDGLRDSITNTQPLSAHLASRVVITGGSPGLALPQSRTTFTDDEGIDRTIYLPPVNITSSQVSYFWVSENGSTYAGDASQTAPDFTNLAQGAPVPWNVLQPGYKVEIVASGFQLPVNIAFILSPGNQPNSPYYYVTELYGTIKVVTRNGSIGNYATNLLNFNPIGAFPGSGEQGLSGIVVEPATGDVFAAMLYDAAPPSGPHYPKVVRFHSNDGGLTAATQTTILDMVGETQGQSHFISNLSIGPDGKLYVHMGDGFDATTALNLASFRGKILRIHLDGTPPSDNPLYNAADGINAKDYIFGYGFRNPFGGAWRASDGSHYEVENGPSSNDRLARVVSGTSYGWNGTAVSMTTNAIYNWNPPHAPVNIAFVQTGTFGGSGFPSGKLDHAFVTESGPTYATGPQALGKRIVEFVLGAGGTLISGPTKLVEYNGSGQATAAGLTAGPDGLYFTDLYKDLNATSATDRGANVLRIKFVGVVDFSANVTTGNAPLAVQFTDLSNVPSASSWAWDFGDGATAAGQSPSHTYAGNGVYNVRLTVTGANGVAATQKNSYIIVGNIPVGLQAQYFDNITLSGTPLLRIDTTVNFNWGTGRPDPSINADNFSVRWTGQVQPRYSETYTFYTSTDDGVRLWVNDQLLIDKWVDQSTSEWSGTISLLANQQYDIKMEYYEQTGNAVAFLSWSSVSQAKEVIPKSRLYLSDPPLPITLNSFSGHISPQSRTVQLDWSTLSETNNYGFFVQRTKETDSQFADIPNSFIPGHGTSLQHQSYSFTDQTVALPGRYQYRLRQVDLDGSVHYSFSVAIDITTLAVVDQVPREFKLLQNYPNPFNPTTTIKYQIPSTSFVTLKVLDLLGREVATLVNEEVKPGSYVRAFDASGLASAVYLYRLQAGTFAQTRKLLLLK